jgi:hypothetical protein
LLVILALTVAAIPASPALAQPTNDDVSGAVPVTSLPFADAVDASEATLEEGEPDFTCAPLHSTVWYAVTLERNMAVTVDTAGSDYDTVVSVYRGSDFDDFDLVACNDDFTDLQARASFTAAADETFFVQVGAFGEAEFDSAAGQLQISFTRGTKKPTVFKSSFRGSLAFADWFSEEEDGSKFGPGRPIAEATLDLFHVTEEFDPATETVTVTEMFGFTTLDPNQFGIDRRLRSAFVDAELTLDGSRCVFTGDVDDGEAECESFTADVTVSVTWIGEGGIVRDRFIERVQGDDFRFTLHFQGASRDATADGSVTGEVDLVSGPAQFATIAKEASSVMEWFRNGSNLFF